MISLSLCVDPPECRPHVAALICGYLRLRELKLARLYLPVQVLLVLPKEGQLPRQQYKENDTEGPHVRGMAIVVTFARDVRVHVVGGPAEQSQFLLSSGLDAEPEIYNLDSILITWIDQNIVELEVSMDYIMFV
jgi:hypothetical protein